MDSELGGREGVTKQIGVIDSRCKNSQILSLYTEFHWE